MKFSTLEYFGLLTLLAVAIIFVALILSSSRQAHNNQEQKAFKEAGYEWFGGKCLDVTVIKIDA